MIDGDEVNVFTRLCDALAAAETEEREFAREVTAEEPGSVSLYEAFSQWAAEVFDSARSLQTRAKAGELLAEHIGAAVDEGSTVRQIAELPFVRPLVELHLARFGVDRTRTGAGRLYKVLDVLIDAKLHPRAQSYLSSVAQLYILGFNAEAVVMARSALEAALESAMHDSRASDDRHERTLYELIQAAGPRGARILDEAGVRDATDIRKAGRDAVHFQLGAQKLQALEAIRALHRVLTQIPSADS